jgi:hypothetical protein
MNSTLLPLPVSTRPDAIAATIGRTPASQAWSRIVVEDDSARRMFAATKSGSLQRITKE